MMVAHEEADFISALSVLCRVMGVRCIREHDGTFTVMTQQSVHRSNYLVLS